MHFLSSKVCLWDRNIDLKVTGNGDFAKICRNYSDSRPQISPHFSSQFHLSHRKELAYLRVPWFV